MKYYFHFQDKENKGQRFKYPAQNFTCKNI